MKLLKCVRRKQRLQSKSAMYYWLVSLLLANFGQISCLMSNVTNFFLQNSSRPFSGASLRSRLSPRKMILVMITNRCSSCLPTSRHSSLHVRSCQSRAQPAQAHSQSLLIIYRQRSSNTSHPTCSQSHSLATTCSPAASSKPRAATPIISLCTCLTLNSYCS